MQAHLLCALHGRRYTNASIIASSIRYKRRLSSSFLTREIIHRNVGAITTTTTAGGNTQQGAALIVSPAEQRYKGTRALSWDNKNKRHIHTSSRVTSPMATAASHAADDEDVDEDVVRFAESNLAGLMSPDDFSDSASWIDDQWDMSEASSTSEEEFWDDMDNDGGETDGTATNPLEAQHLAIAEETQEGPLMPRRRREGEKLVARNMADILSSFDPQNPPPPNADLSDIQF
eukprot:14717230-Ditylum_brightwellii.AAC.1